jgi:glycosyltransferase involved in cell wall biosynthesis
MLGYPQRVTADAGNVEADVTLSVIMPVFNERATLRQAVDGILGASLPVDSFELVIVDDGSTDGSREALLDETWPSAVTVLVHDENCGKGTAIRTGLAAARGRYSVVADADLELEPDDIARLLPPLQRGDADAVFGARVFPKGSPRKVRYWIGNKGVTLAANVLFRSSLSDLMTCYKAMPTAVFRSLALEERGFPIEAEIAVRLVQRGARIHQTPVAYDPRRRKAGKKLTMLDGLRVLRTLLRCRVHQVRPLPVGRRADADSPSR